MPVMAAVTLLVRILSFAAGVIIVAGTLLSAVRTFVVPRSATDALTSLVFVSMRKLFNLRMRGMQHYIPRDALMALYAPVSLLTLLPVWYLLVWIGYTLIYLAFGVPTIDEALRLSGSSILTLGFNTSDSLLITLVIFTEGILGLLLVALLIAYLPTMYSAFSRRETRVSLLEVRAGSPPYAPEILARIHRVGNLSQLGPEWQAWELWFNEIEESHTSLAALVFFRSPKPDNSWVTAAGAILDAAALYDSSLDLPMEITPRLTLRAGFVALRAIADFFRIEYDPDPRQGDPISITRDEYEAALDYLEEYGLPIRPDRDQAWLDFAGWRVNYDQVLIALCAVTMAPTAPWSSDRAPERFQPRLLKNWLHPARNRRNPLPTDAEREALRQRRLHDAEESLRRAQRREAERRARQAAQQIAQPNGDDTNQRS